MAILAPVQLDRLTDDDYSASRTNAPVASVSAVEGSPDKVSAPAPKESAPVFSLPGQNDNAGVSEQKQGPLQRTERADDLGPLSPAIVARKEREDEKNSEYNRQRALRLEQRMENLQDRMMARSENMLSSLMSHELANREWDRRHAIEARDRNSRSPLYISGSGTGRLTSTVATALAGLFGSDDTGDEPLARTDPMKAMMNELDAMTRKAMEDAKRQSDLITGKTGASPSPSAAPAKKAGGVFFGFTSGDRRTVSKSDGTEKVSGMTFDEWRRKVSDGDSVAELVGTTAGRR